MLNLEREETDVAELLLIVEVVSAKADRKQVSVPGIPAQRSHLQINKSLCVVAKARSKGQQFDNIFIDRFCR